MIQQDIEIINKLGLHARASAKLTQLAAKYKSEVWMTRNKRRVNAKSIMGVMMLAAGRGAVVRAAIASRAVRSTNSCSKEVPGAGVAAGASCVAAGEQASRVSRRAKAKRRGIAAESSSRLQRPRPRSHAPLAGHSHRRTG